MDLLIDVRVARRDSTTSAETAGSAQDRTVRLRADHTGTVTDLIAALLGGLDPADRPQQATWAWNLRTGRRLDPARPLGAQGLRCGDTVVLGPPEQAPDAPVTPPGLAEHRFELLVVAGPDAGRWLPLPAGEFVIGTDPASDLLLADPTAGRRHLHLGIGSHEVAATDLAHPAGTSIDGEPLHGTVTLTSGQLLRLGSTLVTVEEVPAESPAPAGPPPAVWLPAVPQPAKKRRLAFRRRGARPGGRVRRRRRTGRGRRRAQAPGGAADPPVGDAEPGPPGAGRRTVRRRRRRPPLHHPHRTAPRAPPDPERAERPERSERAEHRRAGVGGSGLWTRRPTTPGTSSRCGCGPRTSPAGCGSSSRRPGPTPTPRTSNGPTNCASTARRRPRRARRTRPTCGSSACSPPPGRSRPPTGSCGPG